MLSIKKIQDILRSLLERIKKLKFKELFRDKRLIRRTILILVCVFLMLHVRSCLLEKKKKEIPPRPVQTALAVQKDVPVYITSFGTLDADTSVDIKSQVTGKIKEIHFKEGDDVKEGDLLFVIDPDPYKAALDKAEASLAQAKVDHKLKKDTLQRNKLLFEKELISQQDFEQYQTDADAAEAEVKLDEANVETAKINLDYCYIHSPLDGVTGRKDGDVGDLVTANSDQVLVSVKDIDLIDVDFTVPERNFPQVMKAGKNGKLKIEVIVEGDDGTSYTGELSYYDNTVDETTGTVFLEGIVANPERKLWPGQFVTVSLLVDTVEGATVVPYESVQLGKQGSYLFVVTDENKADLRIVKAGAKDGNDLVIEKGVEVGEKVVTTGQMGLSPGIPVVDASGKQEKKKSSVWDLNWLKEAEKRVKQWFSPKSS